MLKVLIQGYQKVTMHLTSCDRHAQREFLISLYYKSGMNKRNNNLNNNEDNDKYLLNSSHNPSVSQKWLVPTCTV
jgi:hypothetical protein